MNRETRFLAPFVALMVLSGLFSEALAAKEQWTCEWFGWGCDEGASNQTFIDVGRKNTVEGFLIFDADSAVIESPLSIEFSKRSVALGDFLEVQWKGERLPNGSSIELDGQSILPPNWVQILAVRETWTGALVIRVPPTGEDHSIQGELIFKTHGFERAGNQELKGQSALSMVRYQGEVDSDWHWFKRFLFWLIILFCTSVALWKWGVAPIRYRRFKMSKVQIVGFEGPDRSRPKHSTQHGKLNRSLLRMRSGYRALWLVERRKKFNPMASFFNGRSKRSSGWAMLGGTEVCLLQGATHRRKGWKVDVVWFENGVEKGSKSVFRNNDAEENEVTFKTAEGKSVTLRITLN